MEFTVHNLADLEKVAEYLVKDYLISYKKVFFYGEMGAGKTTLIKMICKKLGVTDNTNSPTFSLVNSYALLDGVSINHADLYRLESSEEAFHAGIYELLFDNDYFFVEWPEKIETLKSDQLLSVTLTVDEDDIRHIKVEEC